MILEETFRWFGPGDPVPLRHVRQTGATGVVTALHHIPVGEVWPVDEIRKRRAMIDAENLTWSVVESLVVHEQIKTRTGDFRKWIDHFRQSLRNLALAGGPKKVTYNFMPVLDWVRTDLSYPLPSGARTVAFQPVAFAAFDLFILQRPGADRDYSPSLREQAEQHFRSLSAGQVMQLERSVVDNFPGQKGVTLQEIGSALALYSGITRSVLKDHLKQFLDEVLPVAEENGIQLLLHPDDPPFPVLGLPRIFSTGEDICDLLSMSDSASNGICFCAGSFSAREENDLPRMFELARKRIGFLHLRSTTTDSSGTMIEAGHLEGRVDMFALVKAALAEAARRRASSDPAWRIPFRPDHGHVLLDDLGKDGVTPGYSAIGRLRGLAELRGLELGIARSCFPELAAT